MVYRRRYRPNTLEPTGSLPERVIHSVRGRTVLGLVVNPKTRQLALAVTDGEYVGIRDLREENPLWSLGRGYYETRSDEDSKHTGLPRSHTPQGVAIKGMGWGTCLYTALCLGAYQVEKDLVKIQMETTGEGICSQESDRSREADHWWDRAVSLDLAERDETEETEEREENVSISVEPRELAGCVTVDDDASVVYVNDVNVDLDRKVPGKIVDKYEYGDAWNNDLIACELNIYVPNAVREGSDLRFLWESLLADSDQIADVNSDALLGLDVVGLEADAVDLLALCYIKAGFGD